MTELIVAGKIIKGFAGDEVKLPENENLIKIKKVIREAVGGMKADDFRIKSIVKDALNKGFDDGILSMPAEWVNEFSVNVHLAGEVKETEIEIDFTNGKE